MLRFMLAVGLSVSGFFGLAAASRGQDQPASGPTPVADPDWRPTVGDRVMVRQAGAVGLPDRATCERYIRSAAAGDRAGMDQAGATKGAVRLAGDTPVLVVEPHGLPARPTGSSSSLESLNRDIQDAINRAASRPAPRVSIEARVLDGPHRGALTFVPMGDLIKYKPAPAGDRFAAGDRLVVAARSLVMGDDESYLLQFLGDPDGGSNRAHVLAIPRGSKVTVLAVGEHSCRVRVTTGRHAGRVGHVKADGLATIPVPAPKAARK